MTRITIIIDVDKEPREVAMALNVTASRLADHVALMTRNTLEPAGAMRITAEAHTSSPARRARYDFRG